MTRPATRRAALALLPCAILPAACAPATTPGAEELAALRAGTRTLVLLRLVGTDQHGTTRQPLAMDWGHDPIGTGWGDFDSGGAPRVWRFHSPSDQAWRDGWVAMVVPPGQYYLFVQSPRRGDAITYAAQLPQAPRWRIEVPRGAALLYAGTLALGEVTQSGLFTRLWVGLDPARTEIRDESAAAAALAARDLPFLPPPRTRLMQPHTGPVRLGPPP